MRRGERWTSVQCESAFDGLTRRSNSRRWPAFCVLPMLVALLATRPTFAYRTSSDLPELAGSGPIGFHDSSIRLQLFSEMPPEISSSHVEEAVLAAAEAWSAPSCSGLSFSYDGLTQIEAAPGDGLNSVQWISDWEERGFDAGAAGLTDVQYAQMDETTWYIVEADVYLNRSFTWSTTAHEGTQDVLTVLIHELGHVVGLLHPCELVAHDGAPSCDDVSEAATAIMYPVYAPGQALSDDDINGVCYLYPAQECTDSSCAAEEVCGDDGACHPRCGTADDWCRPGTVCDTVSCVRPPASCGSKGCVGNSCEEDRDCALHEFCGAGECARGDSALGDPCNEARQCFDGACVDGACAMSCIFAHDCPGSAECDRASGACIDELKPMGSVCAAPSECRGDRCLATEGDAAACTRSCADGQPQCPNRWHCKDVENEPVCVRDQRAPEGCSLSFALSPQSSTTRAGGLLALLLLAGSRRLLARRKSSP